MTESKQVRRKKKGRWPALLSLLAGTCALLAGCEQSLSATNSDSSTPTAGPVVSGPLYTTNKPLGLLRDIVHVGGTYYLYEEETADSLHWSIHVRTSSDGLRWSAPGPAVMAAGKQGDFDANGQADPSVIYNGPGHWQMWFDSYDDRGFSRALGYATSSDGLSWTKLGAVLTTGAVGTWDKALVHHPCVIKVAGTYYMFYAGHASGSSHLNIGLATSPNGRAWTKNADSPVISCGAAGEWDETQVRPASPVQVGSQWVMFYWGKSDPNKQDQLGLAVSDDLVNWTKLGVLFEPTGDLRHSTYHSTVGPQASATIFEDHVYKTWFSGKSDSTGTYGTYLLTTPPAYLALRLAEQP